MQRLSTCRQDAQARTGWEEGGRELSAGPHEMLAVVQHQQQLTPGQASNDASMSDRWDCSWTPRADATAHGTSAGSVSATSVTRHTPSFNEPTSAIRRREPGGLPTAAHASQGDQAPIRLEHEFAQVSDVVIPSDECCARRGQVVPGGRHSR
jgi:hypothetical protein